MNRTPARSKRSWFASLSVTLVLSASADTVAEDDAGDGDLVDDEFADFAVGETRHYIRGERDAQSLRLMSLNGPVSDRASLGMSSTRSEMMFR